LDRSVDILYAYLAAILKTNVHPIADALMDDRGDADPAGLCERLQACSNVDAIAIDVVAVDNDIAEIDANAQDDRWLGSALVCSRMLYRKGAVNGIHHAPELDDGAIAD
jgi:hypothetical protein